MPLFAAYVGLLCWHVGMGWGDVSGAGILRRGMLEVLLRLLYIRGGIDSEYRQAHEPC